MNVADELSLAEKFFEDCKDLLKSKAHDYVPDEDALRNFQRHGVRGICIRLDDKICRLENLADKPAKHENLEDTCRDIANYAFLAYAVMKEKKDMAHHAMQPGDIIDTDTGKIYRPDKRV